MAMTDGLVFILHAPGDAAYAADLAAALTPLAAFPFSISASESRQIEFGAGATSVLLLESGGDAGYAAIAGALRDQNTVVCAPPGCAVPQSLRCYSSISLPADISVAAVLLRDAIAAKQSDAPTRSVAPLLTTQASPARDGGKGSMLARSAWGLAATFVVAGVVAPVIGARAGVSSATPLGVTTEAAASDVTLVAQPVEMDAAPPQHFDPPPLVELLDHLDRNAPAAVESISASHVEVALAPATASFSAPAQVNVEIAPATQIGAVAFVEPEGEAASQDRTADQPRVATAASKSA
jgi:hypothetical protein